MEPTAERERNQQFVLEVFRCVLRRVPSEEELRYGVQGLTTGRDPREYFLEVAGTPEATFFHDAFCEVPLFVPPGHYYSPIANPRDLARMRLPTLDVPDPMPDLDLGYDRQLEFFEELSVHFGRIPFPELPTAAFRYSFQNDFFGPGDALVLSAMIQTFRPKRIIEVGSGFSSAVILDTLDALGAPASTTTCTFIEPYPARLHALLRPADAQRVRIVESGIQSVDLREFASLEVDDLLFFDTTHISKTGSDVNHEIFHILPRLKPGVLIHFHDIFHAFEYPREWIMDHNRSWNEAYLLRAFLMNNGRYRVELLTDGLAKARTEAVVRLSPVVAEQPGGALWLRKL